MSFRGQLLIVSPELDMVTVINSGLGESLNYDMQQLGNRMLAFGNCIAEVFDVNLMWSE